MCVFKAYKCMCESFNHHEKEDDYSRHERDAREKGHGGLNKWDSSAEQGMKKTTTNS